MPQWKIQQNNPAGRPIPTRQPCCTGARRNFRLVFAVFLGAIFVSACRGGADLPRAVPTEQLPTIIAQTLQAAAMLTPQPKASATDVPTLFVSVQASTSRLDFLTRTPTPTLTATRTATPSATPTRTATPTISPTVTDTPRPQIPLAAIRILSPAPLSKVTSPISVRAILATGAGGNYRVELLGEDGRLLARQVLNYSGERVNASLNLNFEIAGVAETGRLQVFTEDDAGRIIALSSSNIILMSVGLDEYNPPGELLERIFIVQPSAEDVLLGGSLNVLGKALPNEGEPLLLELIAPNGAVVGQRLANVIAEPGEMYGTFSAEIPYQVNEPTQVRLTISEDIDRIPGKTHITTLEITINP
jgi:hypothetical protein